MDINCSCGFDGHADEEFFYFWRCPDCKRVWRVNGHVEFVEVFADEEKKLGSSITEIEKYDQE